MRVLVRSEIGAGTVRPLTHFKTQQFVPKNSEPTPRTQVILKGSTPRTSQEKRRTYSFLLSTAHSLERVYTQIYVLYRPFIAVLLSPHRTYYFMIDNTLYHLLLDVWRLYFF